MYGTFGVDFVAADGDRVMVVALTGRQWQALCDATGVADAVAVEELFWGHNVTTGIGVSHGRGVILLAIEQYGAPLFEYTPNQVKQAVVGYGGAEKRQVMDMTRRILKMEKVARPDDAADAIAIALCHAQTSRGLFRGEPI